MRESKAIAKWELRKRLYDNRIIWPLIGAILVFHGLLPVPEGWGSSGGMFLSGFSGPLTGPSLLLVLLCLYQIVLYPSLSLLGDMGKPWHVLEQMACRSAARTVVIRLLVTFLFSAAAVAAIYLDSWFLRRFWTATTTYLTITADVPDMLQMLWSGAVAYPVTALAAWQTACLWFSRKWPRRAAGVALFLLALYLHNLAWHIGAGVPGFAADGVLTALFFVAAVKL